MKKKTLSFLKIFLICFLTSICSQFIFHGFPLIGLPQQDDILCATITNKITNEIVVVNDVEELEMARNVANFLNFKMGINVTEKENPKFEIVYELKNHKKVTISANEKTVYFKDKALPIKGDNGEVFVNIVEGYFFKP